MSTETALVFGSFAVVVAILVNPVLGAALLAVIVHFWREGT